MAIPLGILKRNGKMAWLHGIKFEVDEMEGSSFTFVRVKKSKSPEPVGSVSIWFNEGVYEVNGREFKSKAKAVKYAKERLENEVGEKIQYAAYLSNYAKNYIPFVAQ